LEARGNINEICYKNDTDARDEAEVDKEVYHLWFPAVFSSKTKIIYHFLLPQTILTPFTTLRIAVMAESSPSSDLTHQLDFSVIDPTRNRLIQ